MERVEVEIGVGVGVVVEVGVGVEVGVVVGVAMSVTRPRGIGASDAAAAVGVHPHLSPVGLWLRMTGREPEREESEAMLWGTLLEPVLREELERREGVAIVTPNGDNHWRDDRTGPVFQFCHPDGWIGDDGLAEIKTGGIWTASDWQDGIPIQYQAQAAHQLAVTDRDYVLFGCLIGGQRFVTARYDRDGETERWLIDRERDFWQYVESDTPPPLTQATADDLKVLYPESDGGVCVLDDTPELIERLRLARDAEKSAAAATEAVENEVKGRMGTCEVATLNGAKVASWASHERRSIDGAKVRALAPEVAAECEKVATVRSFRVY